MSTLIEKFKAESQSYQEKSNYKLNALVDKWIWHGMARGLEKAIDIVKQHSDWISVDERLPDKDGFYLCVVQIGAIDKIKSVTKVGFENRATGGYFRLGDWQSVTHWQPLPKPPSEVQP